MKKTFLYFAVFCVILFVLTICGWLIWHYQGLKPELLFELPVAKCKTIRLNTNNLNRVWLTYGSEVDRICRSKGFKSELRGTHDSFFAVSGNKAIRFVPEGFHGVKGDIEFERADSNKVYFYRYRARYYPIVLQP